MGIGGAFLTLSAFNSFYFDMVNGRGWICIALVVFGSWRPGKALLGALLFAAFDAYQLRLQQLAGAFVPYQVFLMLPYVSSILALIVMSRPRHLSTRADDPLSQGRALTAEVLQVDILVRNGTLSDGRRADIGIAGGRIAAIAAAHRRRGRPTPSTRPAASSRRRSWTCTSIWTRRCPTASRASIAPAPCSRASRCGAS